MSVPNFSAAGSERLTLFAETHSGTKSADPPPADCGRILVADRSKRIMDSAIDIGTLIVSDPEIRGGRPRLAGTGVTVRRIVGWYRLGLTAEEIADRFGHLTLAQVHAALAYYHANRAEIEADIQADESEADALESAHG